MQRIAIQEQGFLGAIHLPKGKRGPYPLVVTIGGFRGGLNESRAEKLADHGFASLALAYFGGPGLPSALREIPLEYCERIIEYAASHPLIDPHRIALWGVSRGAELSLILASVIPNRFRTIVATVPASAIYGSIQWDAPAWIYRGARLRPDAPFPRLQIAPDVGQTPESALMLTPYFLEGMKDEVAFAASQIPVEQIACPLLLFSGEDDQMWPSSLFAQQIEKRLQTQKSSIPCMHICYSNAGHAISSSEEVVQLNSALNLWFSFGGTRRDNFLAKTDSWEKTLRFLRCWL